VSIAAHLRLIRWPGALTAAVNAMTGFLVAKWNAERMTTRQEAVAACAVAAAGAIVYAGGVVLNDVADADRDATLHPGRPIPSGDVARGSANTFGLALLVGGAALAALLGGAAAGAAMAGAALAAYVYDFGAKRSRLAGALVLGFARASNAAAGCLAAVASAAAQERLEQPLVGAYLLAVLAYTAMLTFASTFEERTPSRATAASFAISLFVLAALPWSVFHAQWRLGPALAYLPLAGTLLVAARSAAEPDGPGVGLLVRAGVFGFLLADAAWLFGVGRYESGFALILAYVGMRFALSRARS
jgi:4-hydroxybenzoate polyprenyltransferase